mgnify:CR=1 FL=1
MHTALDNSDKGVNAKICNILGLTNTSILIPQKGTIKKLTTYVPKNDAKKLKEALFNAGAGTLGNYSNCSFSAEGVGSYKAGENSNPTKSNQNIGMGMVGDLLNAVDELDFFHHIKKTMNVTCIRHSNLLNKKIKKVAVLGGSGSFAINAAKAVNADIFITSDLKYHQFYEAEDKLILADIGHFDILTKKIPNFAISLSESITNPIKYF